MEIFAWGRIINRLKTKRKPNLFQLKRLLLAAVKIANISVKNLAIYTFINHYLLWSYSPIILFCLLKTALDILL